MDNVYDLLMRGEGIGDTPFESEDLKCLNPKREL